MYTMAAGQCLLSLQSGDNGCRQVDTTQLSHLADFLGQLLIRPDNSFRHCSAAARVYVGTMTCSRGKIVD